MHLNGGYGDRLQCIKNGDRGVGVGGRVDNDAVEDAVCVLDLVHNDTLVIGLKNLKFRAVLDAGVLYKTAKRAVEKTSATEAEARKKVGYLRALETVSRKWREAGVDIGNWLGVLSPKKAKAFVDYMEYRFSQGDYNNRYTIDTFIRDFGELVKRNYDFKDIQGDFSRFLEKQKVLGGNMRRAKKYGITEDEIDSAWRTMAKSI